MYKSTGVGEKPSLARSGINEKSPIFDRSLGKLIASTSKRDSTIMQSARKVQKPNQPIPAYTSVRAQEKYSKEKNNRYINTKMENELASYKIEIDKRFNKSALKNYLFPKQVTEVFHTIPDRQLI